MDDGLHNDLSERLTQELPFLRRYARALSGSQELGDTFAINTLEAILKDRNILAANRTLNVALFSVFHTIWRATLKTEAFAADDPLGRVQELLKDSPPNTREALLLSSIEGFTDAQVGAILNTSPQEAKALITGAKLEMLNQSRGSILVIEDEPIIAADIVSIVERAGYSVDGVARTQTEAVKLGNAQRPSLILADIQLADNSSGIDAVKDILGLYGDIPVIFITAFPERLLTGTPSEPAFLITKPYTEDHVTSSVSQAMLFASTQTLT